MFNNKFIHWASQSRLLKSIALMVPNKLWVPLTLKFSLLNNKSKELTQALIEILENEPQWTAGLEKKDKVLNFLKRNKYGVTSSNFPRIWLQKMGGKTIFNFNGALLPNLTPNDAVMFNNVFCDIFLFSLFFDDKYPAELVRRLDVLMEEGPYGYTDENFDVTVKAGDIVIDAGSWIGDFSAYAASRGATAYAFEPASEIFKSLQETAELNNISNGGGGENFSWKERAWIN
jgi:hypothetical protein